MVDIDDKVLNFSRHNVDTAKAPKKGQYFFSDKVKPEELKKSVIKLEDSMAKYAQICDNRNSHAMGLTERS